MSAPRPVTHGQPAWVLAQQAQQAQARPARPAAQAVAGTTTSGRTVLLANATPTSAVVVTTTTTVATVVLPANAVRPGTVAVAMVAPHAVIAPVVVGQTSQPAVVLVQQAAARQPHLVAGRQIPGTRR